MVLQRQNRNDCGVRAQTTDMHQDDSEAFEKLLKQLGEAFNRKLSDELIQAYWKSLKDLPLGAIQRMADSHMRFKKFFPKPFELRPEDAPAEKKSSPGYEEGCRRSIENWEERLRLDPIGARRELLSAYIARVEASEKRGSIAYDERMEFARQAGLRIDAMAREKVA